MLATVRRLSFHYTPLPTKYLYDPPPDRHRLTTYAKIKLEKIAPERILSKRWGSWANDSRRQAVARLTAIQAVLATARKIANPEAISSAVMQSGGQRRMPARPQGNKSKPLRKAA